jgi:hypothetical protein
MYVPIPGLESLVERWWSRWVRRGRTGPAPFAPDGSGWVLTYTARYRLTAFLLFAGFSALYGYVLYSGRLFKTGSWRDLAVAVGSVLLWIVCASIFVASRVERVTVTPQDLRRRFWGGRQQVAWSDVNVMKIDHPSNDLKIGVEGGTVIEVSFYLDGLHAVADALQRHLNVPADLLEDVMPPRAGSPGRYVSST